MSIINIFSFYDTFLCTHCSKRKCELYHAYCRLKILHNEDIDINPLLKKARIGWENFDKSMIGQDE